MTEGEILNFFVAIGDQVKVDEPLIEVQTDKMVAEIPSPASGKVTSIYFKRGETVTVGETILEIDSGQKQVSKQKKGTYSDDERKKRDKPRLPKRYNGILAAPYTRKIARELGVNIENIKGTGRAGRVTEEDVYAFINKVETESQPAGMKEKPVEQPAEMVAQSELVITESPQPIVGTIPFKGIRKQIAKNLSYSVRTIPHVTHYDEADITNLLAYREEMKSLESHISIVAFFIKALAVALKAHPVFNAELDEKEEVIRLYKTMNIGLATDTEAGLLVPVLNDADNKSLLDTHSEMKTLTEKAQQGKLSVKEMQGATFTISNVGPLGGTAATPIINHPQTGIMAFHKTKKTPVVMENDEIKIRSMMNLSFSFDHRVADGADAVRFTNQFIELIEEPKKLFLELT